VDIDDTHFTHAAVMLFCYAHAKFYHRDGWLSITLEEMSQISFFCLNIKDTEILQLDCEVLVHN